MSEPESHEQDASEKESDGFLTDAELVRRSKVLAGSLGDALVEPDRFLKAMPRLESLDAALAAQARLLLDGTEPIRAAQEEVERFGRRIVADDSALMESMHAAAAEVMKPFNQAIQWDLARAAYIEELGRSLDFPMKPPSVFGDKVLVDLLSGPESIAALADRFITDAVEGPDVSGLLNSPWLSTDSNLLSSFTNQTPTPTSAPPVDCFWPLDRPEPLPTGGTLCASFTITRGTAKQVTVVLDEEFHRRRFPVCHLVSHERELLWHVELFEGSETEARELLDATGRDTNRDWFHFWEQWDEKTCQIGYAQVSDRPIIPVRFYIFDEDKTQLVTDLAASVAEVLRKNGFELGEPDSAADSMEDRLTGTLDVQPLKVMSTIDRFESTLRSTLVSLGLMLESQIVKQQVGTDRAIRVEYPSAGCMVVFKVAVADPGWLHVSPAIWSWHDFPMLRERRMGEAREHLDQVIDLLKAQARWAPVKPSSDEPIENWFAYFHLCKAARIKFTLRDIANELGYSYGHVRGLHAVYRAENNI